MNNFWQRAITGTIFVVVLVGATVLGEEYIGLIFGIIVTLGLFEFYKLFDNTDIKPQKVIGTIMGTLFYFAFIIDFYLPIKNPNYVALLVPILGFTIIAGSELFRFEKKPFENIAVTLIGVIYIALPFVLLLNLGTGGIGGEWYNFWKILSIFILVWCNDTFAYLTGRLLGKHKLFERISPKKTWEGFIGGVVFAILAGIIMAYFLDWSYAKMITYGIVVGVIGTAGDLVESMLKRSVDVKDSGTILPGHGGILDRFDAVLFVVPVIFFLENFIFNSLD